MTISYLHYPPFDMLTDDQRALLGRHSQIIYLDKGQHLPDTWIGDFFIIIKGKLTQYHDDELIAGLNAHDWFSTIGKKDGTRYHFITQEQSLLYHMNGETLLGITAHNTQLQESLFADLSVRRQRYNARQSHTQNQQLLLRPIKTLNDHIKPAYFVENNASLFDAASLMNTHNTKHVLVKGTSSNPAIGMFTQTDLCRAISDRADLDSSVLAYSNFQLQSIHIDHEISEALLIMLHQKIHRLPLIDDTGQIVGILGQTELLHFLSNHSQFIISKIEQAQTTNDLHSAVDMIGKFIRHHVQAGTKTHLIARTVQSLNIQIFARLWQLMVPSEIYENTCLMVMGSEGRGEQIMRTDQDNALIIADGFEHDDLPKLAQAFNDKLSQMGYPYCDGNIMIGNPMWRCHLSDFKHQINQWFTRSDDGMIWLATLLDTYFVCGNLTLFNELLAHINIALTHAPPNFINRFAKAILQFGDGSHFWQKFTGQTNHDIDLKKAGVFPIVHGVRTLALHYNIKATNTRTRLFELAKLGIISQDKATNLVEALDFFLTKRLAVSLQSTDKSAWRVNPNTLSALERDLLKESLAVVKEFKHFISHKYRLDVFGI